MAGNRVGEETKKQLCDSLKKKMKKKPLDKITVREIVEDCGVNRQTFYYHFEDIYDQLRWMYEQELFSILRKNATAESWKDALMILMKYLEDNREIAVCAIKSMGHEYVKHFMYGDIKSIVLPITDSFIKQAGLSDEYEEFITEYITISLAALTESWAWGYIKMTPEQMVDFTETMVEDLLRGAAARKEQKKNI